jgi:tripartite-type tricarboxylate transporter receptor subunit TctC
MTNSYKPSPPPTRRRLLGGALAALGTGLVAPANAQIWPDKPITIIMPYAAGGPTDATFRNLALKMSEDLGQSVVVDNRPGAGAMLGAQLVARANPNGYTLLASVVANMVTNPLLSDKPVFDPIKDFSHVSLVSTNPLLLVSSNSSGIKDFADMIRQAKAKPGQLSIASYGIGTPSHLAIELLKSSAKIDLIHVPYNGSALAMVDVRGGRVPLLMDILPSHIKTMENGDIIGLAISQAKRSDLAPQVPTMAEIGLPGFEALTWMGLSAPAGTPKEVVERLNLSVQRASADTRYRAALFARGMPPTPTTPEGYAELIRTDLAKWGAVIKAGDIKIK